MTKRSGKKISPFSIYSSSADTGVNKHISDNFTGSVHLANMHEDTYGDLPEASLQGPYTEKFFGGNQHRHQPLNQGADNKSNRAEAYDLEFVNGDVKITSVFGSDPHRPRAELYRDEVAKRPLNIRNIKVSSPGNYSSSVEVLQYPGRSANSKDFVASSSAYQLYPERKTYQNSGPNRISLFHNDILRKEWSLDDDFTSLSSNNYDSSGATIINSTTPSGDTKFLQFSSSASARFIALKGTYAVSGTKARIEYSPFVTKSAEPPGDGLSDRLLLQFASSTGSYNTWTTLQSTAFSDLTKNTAVDIQRIKTLVYGERVSDNNFKILTSSVSRALHGGIFASEASASSEIGPILDHSNFFFQNQEGTPTWTVYQSLLVKVDNHNEKIYYVTTGDDEDNIGVFTSSYDGSNFGIIINGSELRHGTSSSDLPTHYGPTNLEVCTSSINKIYIMDDWRSGDTYSGLGYGRIMQADLDGSNLDIFLDMKYFPITGNFLNIPDATSSFSTSSAWNFSSWNSDHSGNWTHNSGSAINNGRFSFRGGISKTQPASMPNTNASNNNTRYLQYSHYLSGNTQVTFDFSNGLDNLHTDANATANSSLNAEVSFDEGTNWFPVVTASHHSDYGEFVAANGATTASCVATILPHLYGQSHSASYKFRFIQNHFNNEQTPHKLYGLNDGFASVSTNNYDTNGISSESGYAVFTGGNGSARTLAFKSAYAVTGNLPNKEQNSLNIKWHPYIKSTFPSSSAGTKMLLQYASSTGSYNTWETIQETNTDEFQTSVASTTRKSTKVVYGLSSTNTNYSINTGSIIRTLAGSVYDTEPSSSTQHGKIADYQSVGATKVSTAPLSVATDSDNDKVYFSIATNSDTHVGIWRCDLDGQNATEILDHSDFRPGSADYESMAPRNLVVASGSIDKLFFIDDHYDGTTNAVYASGSIWKCDLDGTNLEKFLNIQDFPITGNMPALAAWDGSRGTGQSLSASASEARIDVGHTDSWIANVGTNAPKPRLVTVCAWVKFNAAAQHNTYPRFFTVGDTNFAIYYNRGVSPDSIAIYQKYGTSHKDRYWYSTSGGAIADDTWTHIAVTFNPGTTYANRSSPTFYINGSAVGNVVQSSNNTPSSGDVPNYDIGDSSEDRMIIGNDANFYDNADTWGREYSGNMSNLVIYNDILTATEISNIYNGGEVLDPRTIREEDLFAYWPMDDGVANVNDLGPHSLNGTATSWANDSNAPAHDREGGWTTSNAAAVNRTSTDTDGLNSITSYRMYFNNGSQTTLPTNLTSKTNSTTNAPGRHATLNREFSGSIRVTCDIGVGQNFPEESGGEQLFVLVSKDDTNWHAAFIAAARDSAHSTYGSYTDLTLPNSHTNRERRGIKFNIRPADFGFEYNDTYKIRFAQYRFSSTFDQWSVDNIKIEKSAKDLSQNYSFGACAVDEINEKFHFAFHQAATSYDELAEITFHSCSLANSTASFGPTTGHSLNFDTVNNICIVDNTYYYLDDDDHIRKLNSTIPSNGTATTTLLTDSNNISALAHDQVEDRFLVFKRDKELVSYTKDFSSNFSLSKNLFTHNNVAHNFSNIAIYYDDSYKSLNNAQTAAPISFDFNVSNYAADNNTENFIFRVSQPTYGGELSDVISLNSLSGAFTASAPLPDSTQGVDGSYFLIHRDTYQIDNVSFQSRYRDLTARYSLGSMYVDQNTSKLYFSFYDVPQSYSNPEQHHDNISPLNGAIFSASLSQPAVPAVFKSVDFDKGNASRSMTKIGDHIYWSTPDGRIYHTVNGFYVKIGTNASHIDYDINSGRLITYDYSASKRKIYSLGSPTTTATSNHDKIYLAPAFDESQSRIISQNGIGVITGSVGTAEYAFINRSVDFVPVNNSTNSNAQESFIFRIFQEAQGGLLQDQWGIDYLSGAFTGTLAAPDSSTVSDIRNPYYDPPLYEIEPDLNFTLPTRVKNKNVMVSRFSSPGDKYTMSRGYLNTHSEEHSIYNASTFRNLIARQDLRNKLSKHMTSTGHESGSVS